MAHKPTEVNLADSSFCEVLAELSRRGETGVLRLSGAAHSKSVYLQEGKIVFASSTDPDDRLGELLLTRGIISRQQLEEASKNLNPGKRLGTALVEQGFLPAEDLPRWVREQVKEILFSLFSWTEGGCVFEAGPFPSDEAITLRLSTPEVFLAGLKLVQKWSVLRKGAGEIRIPYRLCTQPRALLKEAPLGEEEEKLLRLLESRPVTMEQAALESGLTTLRVYQLFFAFRVIGVIAPIKTPPAAPRAAESSAAHRPGEATAAPNPGETITAAPRPAEAQSTGKPAPPTAPMPAPIAEELGSQTIMLHLEDLSGAEAAVNNGSGATALAAGVKAWQVATDQPHPPGSVEKSAPEPAPVEVVEPHLPPRKSPAPAAGSVVKSVPVAPAEPHHPASKPQAAAVSVAKPAPLPVPVAPAAIDNPVLPENAAEPVLTPKVSRTAPTPAALPKTQGPPALPTVSDAPAQAAAAAAAAKRAKPDLRVVRLDERRLEGEGPQHLEDLVRQWILKGYRLAGVVPARAAGLFGSSGSTYLIFIRENSL